MNRSRRIFLTTGVLGAAALATAGWVRVRVAPNLRDGHALDDQARGIVAAMVPAFLAGALPLDATARTTAVRETVDDVDTAVAGLPPATQAELAQLFALLGVAPARLALAGLRTTWSDARPDAVQAALERWRLSRIALLRTAYDGLHQLVLAAWYGNPRAWDAIGYPGPPRLT
jgi:hypothetical protein